MIAQRLTLITLAVADIGRALAYHRALGWEPSFANDDVAFFDMPGFKLGLFTRAGLARETGRAEADLGTGASSISVNHADRAGVDAAHAAALAAGAREVTAPEATAWGGYSGYVEDPDGHLWENAHNPFWDLTEEGWLA